MDLEVTKNKKQNKLKITEKQLKTQSICITVLFSYSWAIQMNTFEGCVRISRFLLSSQTTELQSLFQNSD